MLFSKVLFWVAFDLVKLGGEGGGAYLLESHVRFIDSVCSNFVVRPNHFFKLFPHV
jgi:hypothetical protein